MPRACAEIYGPFVRRHGDLAGGASAPDEREFAERISRISADASVAGRGGRWRGGGVRVCLAAPGSGRRTGGRPTWPSTSTRPSPARDRARSLRRAARRCSSARGSRSRAPGSRSPTTRASHCTRRAASSRSGVYRRIGWKVGEWRDVGWWQLRAGAANRRRAGRAWAAGAARGRPSRALRPRRTAGAAPASRSWSSRLSALRTVRQIGDVGPRQRPEQRDQDEVTGDHRPRLER